MILNVLKKITTIETENKTIKSIFHMQTKMIVNF